MTFGGDRSIRVIALGDQASVPSGQYGKQTLLSLHLRLAKRLIYKLMYPKITGAHRASRLSRGG